MLSSITPGNHLSDFAFGVLVGGIMVFAPMYYFLEKEKENSKNAMKEFGEGITHMLNMVTPQNFTAPAIDK